MNMKQVARAACVAASSLLVLAAAALPAQASTGTGWRIFARFSAHGAQISLNGVAAISAQDAWAAGTSLKGSTSSAFVVRWNGKSWRQVKLPGSVKTALDTAKTQSVGIRATGSADVWLYSAHGYARWTGHSWRTGTFPAAVRNQPAGLLVFSSRDAWLVGTNDASSTATAFAEQYNGHGWQAMPPPPVTYFQVAASSAKSICVVNGGVGEASDTTTVLACWHGSSWQDVTLPASLDQQDATIGSILVSSPDSVWLGGEVNASGDGLAAHWLNGTWHVTTLPAVTTLGQDVLSLLVPDGHGGMWARGYAPFTPAYRIWHYTGGHWAGPTLPNIGGSINSLLDIAAVPGTSSAWAVGLRNNDGIVVLHGRRPA